jgi:hypothetical protein
MGMQVMLGHILFVSYMWMHFNLYVMGMQVMLGQQINLTT